MPPCAESVSSDPLGCQWFALPGSLISSRGSETEMSEFETCSEREHGKTETRERQESNERNERNGFWVDIRDESSTAICRMRL